MRKKNISSALLIIAMGLLITAAILYFTGAAVSPGPLMVIALICIAIGFRGFVQLRGFSYTMLILAAVTIAMFHPEYFINVGDFQLKWLIVPFVQLTMFGMGSHMSFEDFKGIVKMPKGVLIGVTCHFTIMPLVGFALSHLFAFPPEIAGGVILIGCVSSAMASNVMSYLAKANLALAVTIGACSTIISPFVTPFLMRWLGGQYIEIDISRMMIDITNMIIIPVVAGFIFNLFYFATDSRKSRILQLTTYAAIIICTNVLLMVTTNGTLGQLVAGLIKSISIFYLLPMIAAILLRKAHRIKRADIEAGLSFLAMMGIIINTVIITASGRNSLLQVGSLLIITCLLHNITGFSVGYFAAKLLGLPERDRRTIAFEVGMQNGGVATGLALQMGKVATVGLASAIFGPLQNITGSALANWFKKRPVKTETTVNEDDIAIRLEHQPAIGRPDL